MLKNTSKIYYSFGGKLLSLSSLFTRIQKRPGGNIIGSGVVNLNRTGEPLLARMVFVRSVLWQLLPGGTRTLVPLVSSSIPVVISP